MQQNAVYKIHFFCIFIFFLLFLWFFFSVFLQIYTIIHSLVNVNPTPQSPGYPGLPGLPDSQTPGLPDLPAFSAQTGFQLFKLKLAQMPPLNSNNSGQTLQPGSRLNTLAQTLIPSSHRAQAAGRRSQARMAGEDGRRGNSQACQLGSILTWINMNQRST